MPYISNAQLANSSASGNLSIQISSSLGYIPVQNATISISLTGDPDSVVERVTSNESGLSPTVTLPAPNPAYSAEPSEQQPYAEYNLSIEAPGYEPTVISGTEILPNVTAVQPVSLTPLAENVQESPIVIPDHTLYGDYPPKIPEDEIKPTNESGEIVLSRVVLPEFVIVHDGVPQDPTARNYYVRYTDYIKNVVSSEIYATWSESTIYANTLAIMSFTLNRVYTEW